MVIRGDQKRVAALLTDAIRTLCKSAIAYNAGFCIEGLLGITSFDDDQVFLVSIHETVTRAGAGASAVPPGLYPNIPQQYPAKAPFHGRDHIGPASHQKRDPPFDEEQSQQPVKHNESQVTDNKEGSTETRVPTIEEIQATAPPDQEREQTDEGRDFHGLREDQTGYPSGMHIKDEVMSETDDDLDDSMDGFDSTFQDEDGAGHPFPQYLSGPMFPGGDASNPGMWPLGMHGNNMMPGQMMQDHPGWMNMPPGGGGPVPEGMMVSPGQLSNWAKLRQETVKRRIYRYRLKLTNPEKWQENKRRDAERKRQLRLTMTDEEREKERLRERERKRRQRKVMKEEAAKELEALNLLQGQPVAPGMLQTGESATPHTSSEFQPMQSYQSPNTGIPLPSLSQQQQPNIPVSGTSGAGGGHMLNTSLNQMPPASILGSMSSLVNNFSNGDYSAGSTAPMMPPILGSISGMNKPLPMAHAAPPEQPPDYNSVKQEHS